MRTLAWTVFFCYLFIFFVMAVEKLHPRPVYNVLFVQKTNMDLAVRTPICLDRSVIPDEEFHWLYFPTDPAELATHEDYAYLSGQLIQAGVVDASDCPFYGLWPTGYANACGLEKTRDISLYLQNVYDDEILASGTNLGVPPVMIKQLIRYESQFWPVPMGLTHFGLGHLTYVGATNALLWNRDLFEDVVAQAPDNLDTPSELLKTMDASCPTCTLKIDVAKAERSIPYLTQVLFAYCRQTSQVVFNATGTNAGNAVDYATIWKLTLLNYNAGPMCVYNAVKIAYSDEPVTWDEIANSVDGKTCDIGVRYVDNITAPYYDFQKPP